MTITKRDKEMFETLYTYAVMTTRQLAENCFPNVHLSTVLRRLRKLERGAYIRRISGLESYEMCWVMREKAALFISSRPPKWRQSRFLLEHDTQLTALRLSLEKSGFARSWIPEHEIRSKITSFHGPGSSKGRLIPDGIMGAQVKGENKSIAVELELNSKSQSRYKGIFYRYHEKRSLHGLWYLTPTVQMGRRIEKFWEIYQPSHHDRRHIKFYWSLLDEALENPSGAKIHSGRKSLPLIRVFEPKRDSISAQALAQRVDEMDPKSRYDWLTTK